MREVAIIGVGAHATGQFTEKSLKDIAYPAIWNALEDAGVQPVDVNVAYVGNSLGGLLTGQEGVRGQVLLQQLAAGRQPAVQVRDLPVALRVVVGGIDDYPAGQRPGGHAAVGLQRDRDHDDVTGGGRLADEVLQRRRAARVAHHDRMPGRHAEPGYRAADASAADKSHCCHDAATAGGRRSFRTAAR